MEYFFFAEKREESLVYITVKDKEWVTPYEVIEGFQTAEDYYNNVMMKKEYEEEDFLERVQLVEITDDDGIVLSSYEPHEV